MNFHFYISFCCVVFMVQNSEKSGPSICVYKLCARINVISFYLTKFTRECIVCIFRMAVFCSCPFRFANEFKYNGNRIKEEGLFCARHFEVEDKKNLSSHQPLKNEKKKEKKSKSIYCIRKWRKRIQVSCVGRLVVVAPSSPIK